MGIANTTIIAMVIGLLSGFSGHQTNTVYPQQGAFHPNILIVYVSRTQNTKVVAEYVHAKIGGDLVGLELINPYPRDYRTTVSQVARENASGYLPPLKTKIDSIQRYDLIFLGFPTWGMQLPPPMKSFLRAYNLAGKTIAPFNTNGGYGVGSSFQTVKELCSKCKLVEGFSIQGGLERDGILLTLAGERAKAAQSAVDVWLRKIGVLK